jgi:hypothetical protein
MMQFRKDQAASQNALPVGIQTSKEVPKRTFKTRRPNSLLFRSLRCLLWGEQKETKETENNGEGFEFAVRGISIPQLF